MFDLLEGKEQHCEFDGVETVLKEDGRYCCVPVTHKATLGEIVDLLEEFKQQPVSLLMPKMPEGSFAKKLFSLYLTYLPAEKFKYAMKMNCDDRGSFTELVHTTDCGQVSINISKPGITKGPALAQLQMGAVYRGSWPWPDPGKKYQYRRAGRI